MATEGDEAIDREATAALHKLVSSDATFRDGQLEAIRSLVNGNRALVVQRTGWGKSAVYFIACDVLRRRGAGPVLVLSPLLVLMRNQIEAATRLGLTAITVNSSQSKEEKAAALDLADTADILFVTPESLHAAWFARDVLSRLSDPSAVVVDEVHCISEWGHNFRPKYRRIRDFLDQLPSNVGVLGTTATATTRAIDDIREQLGEHIATYRGPLVRNSLQLHVKPPADQPTRLAWLAKYVESKDSAGIVYVLTQHDAERVADWLVSRGIDAVAYSGAIPDEDRRGVEQRLLVDDVKAVVATTALGMGYDKPNLTWVVHYQTPAGPIAYYQQVGRAGRGVPVAEGVMLQGPEDEDIHEYFIQSAYPSEELAQQLLDVIDRSDDGVKENQILEEVNIRLGRLQAALVILSDDGVIRREDGRYHRTVKAYAYPRDRVEAVAQARRTEFQELVTYAKGESCLMETLQHALDDPTAAPCERCGPCIGASLDIEPTFEEVQAARDFLWQNAGLLQPRKRWAASSSLPVSGTIPTDRRAGEGRILGRYKDGGYGDELMAARANGKPTERLLDGLVDLFGRWGPDPAPTWVSWIPSVEHDAFLEAVAGRLGVRLGLPVQQSMTKRPDRTPQRSMQNSPQAAANAWSNLALAPGGVPPGPVLLIADVVSTRWTVTVAAHLLRDAGSEAVQPLVMCDVSGGAA